MDTSHLLGRMKNFVRSSEESASTSTIVDDKQVILRRAPFLSGTHVKTFYEKTVGKEALDPTGIVKTKRDEIVRNVKVHEKTLKVSFDVNTLMRAVEAGSTRDVERILEQHNDIVNIKDPFGWTPLMSASCAGNLPMVELLLRWKANLNVRDRKENTCRTLAVVKGHTSIVHILDQYLQDSKHPVRNVEITESSHSRSDKYPTFYCKVCKQSVENTPFTKHIASTIHNFHTASKKKMPTVYGIPESNKGFQILVKSGWNKEEGLGPSGEGHKYPPKTILKQDRTGLGAKKYKAKVTHELGNKKRLTRSSTFSKRDLKADKWKERRLERNLRNMLS